MMNAFKRELSLFRRVILMIFVKLSLFEAQYIVKLNVKHAILMKSCNFQPKFVHFFVSDGNLSVL